MKILIAGLIYCSPVIFAMEPDKESSALTFGPCEFRKSDEQLWLHFTVDGQGKESPFQHNPHISVQLDEIHTAFIPLVYLKEDQNAEKQQKINRRVAEFISRKLKGKKVWIDVKNHYLYAGPYQFRGVVWMSKERKLSLQQLLLQEGLATIEENKFRGFPKKTTE